MLHIPVGPVSSLDFAIYYDCEDDTDTDRFYDCRDSPESIHPTSDTGGICPIPKKEPCRHMNRTFKTSRTPVTQYNRYAEWVRCHRCGHTHAKMIYLFVRCKERYNLMVEEYRRQQHIHWTVQVRQPPIDAVDVTCVCP